MAYVRVRKKSATFYPDFLKNAGARRGDGIPSEPHYAYYIRVIFFEKALSANKVGTFRGKWARYAKVAAATKGEENSSVRGENSGAEHVRLRIRDVSGSPMLLFTNLLTISE